MNFRLAPEIKQLIVRAAVLAGQDLTEFAVAALSDKADEVIEQHDQVLLGSEDYNFFLDVLKEKRPPKPSRRSLKAAANYRCGTRKDVRYMRAD